MNELELGYGPDCATEREIDEAFGTAYEWVTWGEVKPGDWMPGLTGTIGWTVIDTVRSVTGKTVTVTRVLGNINDPAAYVSTKQHKCSTLVERRIVA